MCRCARCGRTGLGGGDYQPGRSDLDLVAVVDRPCTAAEGKRLRGVRRELIAAVPGAALLH